MTRSALVVALVCGFTAGTLAQSKQTPPVAPPKPFPTAAGPTGGATTSKPPAQPSGPAQPAGISSTPIAATSTAPAAGSASTAQAPSEALLGIKIYPNAEYLESFDVGHGQRCYLFGTNMAFTDIVLYYKGQFRGNSGRELFKMPPVQWWDLADFNDKTMAMQPSVVVKDYSATDGGGYLFVSGSAQKKFKTIIQVVPATTR
jgi:hypothetical protein